MSIILYTAHCVQKSDNMNYYDNMTLYCIAEILYTLVLLKLTTRNLILAILKREHLATT